MTPTLTPDAVTFAPTGTCLGNPATCRDCPECGTDNDVTGVVRHIRTRLRAAGQHEITDPELLALAAQIADDDVLWAVAAPIHAPAA